MSVAETADRSPYRGYRFPPEIIAHAAWLYFRFHLSFRDVQDLLAQFAIIVSHQAIRQWCGLDPVRWTFLMSWAKTRENIHDDSASETLLYARVQGADR